MGLTGRSRTERTSRFTMTYKDPVYQHYRSGFKGEASVETLAMGAERLLPVIDIWVKNEPKTEPVFDLGCGTGKLLLAFQQLGLTNLSGCDLSAEQVAVCQNFYTVAEAD